MDVLIKLMETATTCHKLFLQKVVTSWARSSFCIGSLPLADYAQGCCPTNCQACQHKAVRLPNRSLSLEQLLSCRPAASSAYPAWHVDAGKLVSFKRKHLHESVKSPTLFGPCCLFICFSAHLVQACSDYDSFLPRRYHNYDDYDNYIISSL